MKRTCTQSWQDRSNGILISRQAPTPGTYFYGPHRWRYGSTWRHNQEPCRDVWHQTIFWQACEQNLSLSSTIPTPYCTSHRTITSLNFSVFRTLTRVVTGTKKKEHITPILQKQHWLPVSARIQYRIAVITSNIKQTGLPDYLSVSIQPATSSRNLRCTGTNSLNDP